MGVDRGLIMDFIPQAAATLLGMYSLIFHYCL